MTYLRSLRVIIIFGVFYLSNSAFAFDRLVIFGDSLSDTGNIANGFNLPPPYFNNRISNGFVAVDILADRLGLSAESAGQFSNGSGDNYAVSGGNAAGNDIEDLNAQLAAFRIRNPRGVSNNTLVVLMIGGNDLRDARNLASQTARTQTVENAVAEISSTISTLARLGAEYILVSNAPDISRIPETLALADNNPAVSDRASEATSLFNRLLNSRLSQLSSISGGKLVLFDLHTAFNSILDQPQEHGITVVDQGCFDPGRFRLTPGCDFNQFVFFDSIHPTAKVHRILGSALYNSTRVMRIDTIITIPQLLLLE